MNPKQTQKPIPLYELTLGQKAIIVDFMDDSDISQRIEEMGVTPNEEIEMIRSAPLGDPLEIKIRGYLLSLRKEEAKKVLVQPIQ
ncbi:MAG: ferrous iron transport protein A [Candidatus Omnitrophica bacterium]|nr:ferrous iron transport protein A [Candidatus Omnitrophota bacterium]